MPPTGLSPRNRQRPAHPARDSVRGARRRGRRARYALLYVEAADRGAARCADDSLLRIAEAYYGPREHDLRNHCKMLYYSGRACWKRGDQVGGAPAMYLEVEEKLRRIDEPRYLGLLYLRIGEVYHAEQNFARAHRYYREARDLVIRGGDSRDAVIALLGMPRRRCGCAIPRRRGDAARWRSTWPMNCTTIRWPASVLENLPASMSSPTRCASPRSCLAGLRLRSGRHDACGLATRARVSCFGTIRTVRSARCTRPSAGQVIRMTCRRCSIRPIGPMYVRAIIARRRATSIGIFS